MKGRILIVGSGKMARNVGLFLAGRGYATSWVSRDAARLGALESWARKRLRRFTPLGSGPEAATFHRAGDSGLPAADVVIEAVDEQAASKRQALAALPAALRAEALLVSLSSSILPGEIDAACAGLHVFYPVELTRLVELIVPAGYPAERHQRLRALADDLGLDAVEQDERSAFAVNQLLLPLQAECLRALADGCSPAELDQDTISALLPVGQLTLLDAVGLDVVLPAVRNYLGRMPAEQASDLMPLVTGLAELVELGKRGSKNGDGLCAGKALPWPVVPGRRLGPELGRRLFLNGCARALDRGMLDRGALDRALAAVFGASNGFAQALAAEDPAALRATLDALFIRTGRWYFSPADSLGQDRA